MQHWILRSREIAYVLTKEKIVPQLGSPFLRMEPSDENVKPPSAQDWPNLIDSLAAIANPGSVLGLINFPPVDPQFSWFYGNSQNESLALHRQKFDGTEHVIVWPLHPHDVYEDFLSTLDPAMPAPTEGIDLHLDRDTLITLAAIVDIMQEDSLIAFLNRSDPPVSSFNASDLLACFYRSLQGADFRWMAQRVRLISPINLAPAVEDIEAGLAALEKKKLIQHEGDRYGISTELAVVCSRLSECSGFSALSIRKKLSEQPNKGTWHAQHFAAARGLDSLWLFAFSDISQDHFSLELKDSSPAILRQCLESLLLTEGKSERPSQPTPPSPPSKPAERTQERQMKPGKPEKKSLKFCSNCGQKLKPGASFCAGCGYQLTPKGTG